MKDRIKRTNIKKPSHKLFHTMVFTCCISLVASSFLFALLIFVSNENKTLNQTIQNYTVQIDMLEKTDTNDTYLKNK